VAEGKQIVFSAQEYPQLSGIKNGASVKVSADGRVAATDGDSVTVTLENCELETEGRADKELREMSAQPDSNTEGAGASTDDDF
jgi:hypothetical protein